MSGFGAAFLRCIVADARAERAVDETILDIRAERAAAQGAWARVQWFVRSAAAAVRVVVRVFPLEVRALAPGGWTLRLAAWTLFLLVPLLVSPSMEILDEARFSNPVRATLFAALLPQGMAAILPISVFVTALWPPRRSSSPAALQACLAVAIVLLMVQVSPAANQVFRNVAYATLSPGSSPSALRRPPAALTLGELAREGFANPAASPQWRRRTATQFVVLTGLVALAGAFALLGALLSGRSRMSQRSCAGGRLWPYALGMPALALLLLALLEGWGLWVSAATALGLAMRVAGRSGQIYSPSAGRSAGSADR